MGGKTQAGRRDSETEFGNPIADDGAELAVGNSDSDDVETGEHAEVFEAEGEGNAEQDEAEWGELSLKGITYGDVDNFILNWCRNACASKWMDSCILTCILLNTGLLAAAAPANTYSEETLQIFVIIDMVLTIIFTVEMVIRIIALGFWNLSADEDAVPKYLNDAWNQLDFFVVVSSWVNVIVEVTAIDIGIDMKTFRALRILRVLKAFKSIDGIRVILATIGAAVPHTANVVAFLVFLFVVCGIIGVQMFRGATRKRCVYGGFDLLVHVDNDRYPYVDGAFSGLEWNKLVQNTTTHSWPDTTFLNHAGTLLGNIAPWSRPPVALTTSAVNAALAAGNELRTYEYPIGIGIWNTYCTEDTDCPLFDAPEPWNRSQTCMLSLNPGKGFQNYDSAVDAWVALFINMACLYWWEAGHRYQDAGTNAVSANIAWFYGMFNVLFLTMITVNMFVAAVTTIFMDQRSAENPDGGGVAVTADLDVPPPKSKKELRAETWTKPFYFVAAFGGEGPFAEKAKDDSKDMQGIIWNPLFDQFILAFIFINTAALAAEHFDHDECEVLQATELSQCQSASFVKAMVMANYVFNFVFTVECILKVCGMGFREYIRSTFNQLDFFIVVTSTMDMVGEAMREEGEDASGASLFKLFRVFRLFRVLRVARILYRNANLKRVLVTVFGSGEALANLVTFIMFTVLLFAVLGMHLLGGFYHPDSEPDTCAENARSASWQEFGRNNGTVWGQLVGDAHFDIRKEGAEIRYGYDVPDMIRKGLVPRRNFEDFPRAFLLAFQVMTGDDWVNQMHDYMEVRGGLATNLLFFANFGFCNFILLSLFIAVILENFEVAEAEKMKLQMGQREQKLKKAEEEQRKPKIYFVHRLTWLLGGTKAGKKPGTLCGLGDDVLVDPDDGKLLPGESWYNDDNSLFVLGPANKFRTGARKLADNVIFDGIVLCAIILGTVLLALEGAPKSLPAETLKSFDLINDVLFIIFLIEFASKVVGYGFMFTPDSYLKNGWNRLDFIVIIGSLVNYLGGNAGFVRLLRCMRPLRIINKNAGMKVIITAVIDSLAVNVGVLALSGLGLLIFAILGVSLFGGQMWSCNCAYVYPYGVTPTTVMFSTVGGGWVDSTTGMFNSSAPKEVLKEQDCVGYDQAGGLFGIDPSFPNSISQCYWDNRPYNFDTTGNAMMALFTLSTLAGWTDIMEAGMDKAGIGYQPAPFKAFWFCTFFLFYVMIMAFFVTNLFIGVLIDFISTQDGSALLTGDQQKMVDTMKYSTMHRPELHPHAPSNCLRKWFWNLVESQFWNILSSSFIVFNVIIMMCEYEDQSREWWDYLELMNTICLQFFTVEMGFKLIGYFPGEYIADPWNKFDAFVITLSWAAIAAEASGAADTDTDTYDAEQVVLKSAKGIRSLFNTLIMSVAPGFNISVLLLLLYSVYAILGMMLFGNTPVQDLECSIEPTPTTPEYCQWGMGSEVRLDRSDSFSSFARGKPGQMLMGLNRQYTHHASFHNFPSALKLLFQCATGQDWKFVMYAVSGEPGQPGTSSFNGALYFMSFFFLSNYILLNLFVAVILDNFSTSMRESELNVSEEDFIEFKFAFRKLTSDEAPDLLAYNKVWRLLTTIGGSEEPDNKGFVKTNAMSPALETHWGHDQEMAWALNVQSGDKPVSVKGFVKKVYNTASSPLKLPGQPGISFSEYWQILMDTPADYKCVLEDDLQHAFADRLQWEDYRADGGVSGKDENPAPTYEVIKVALKTLRFRENFHHLLQELNFRWKRRRADNVVYEGEGSEVKYDQQLQGLVNVAMGVKALSLEEQLARGVDSVPGWKSDKAQGDAELLELEQVEKQWAEKLQYATMNSKGASLGQREIRELEKQLSRIRDALQEKRETLGISGGDSIDGAEDTVEEPIDVVDQLSSSSERVTTLADLWEAGSYRDFKGTLSVRHAGGAVGGMTTPHKLVCLAVRGVGEVPRLILEVAGSAYEGIYYGQVAFEAAQESLPFNEVPALLNFDGRGATLSNANTIVRFLAAQTGLAGSDDAARTQIDNVYETFLALKPAIEPTVENVASWRQHTARAQHDQVQGTMDEMSKLAQAGKALKTLEDALATAGNSTFLVGDKLSYADLALWNTLFDLAEDDHFPQWADETFGFALPRLKKLKLAIDLMPAIQNYISSERRMPRTKSLGDGRDDPLSYVRGFQSEPTTSDEQPNDPTTNQLKDPAGDE